MNAERLLQHFDRITEAPDAVPRLRRFILDLAVRGKLVEQDPNDEPADELLKRIHAEKERLVKEGRIKEKTPAPGVQESEQPYRVPSSWAWIPFAELIHYSDAGLSPNTEGFPRSGNHWGVLKVSAVSWENFKPEENKQLLPGPTPPESVHVRAGDFLISRANTSELVGKCVIVESQPNRLILSDKIVRLHITEHCDRRFLSFVNNHAGYARSYYASEASGTSQSMKNVSRPVIYGLPIPLPPLAEQHRIVAKVDELTALCDQLEAAKTEREQSRDRLVAASLHCLNEPADPEEADKPDTFRHHAQFIFNHLPRLTTRPAHIKQLRQTILNLAVRGKLVPQDPKDEPASELLKRIQAEKARLVEEGIIPRQKWASSDLNRYAFERPVKWEAVNFGDVCNLVTSGSRGWAEFYSDAGPKFIRAQNIRFGRLRLDDLACVNPPKKTEGTRTQVSNGDLLIVITGAGVTNPALLDRELGEAYVSQHVALIKPTATSLSPWLLLCLMAPAGGRAELVERAYGAGKPGLNLDNIRSLNIPLPPSPSNTASSPKWTN